jgi:hypothetical protein
VAGSGNIDGSMSSSATYSIGTQIKLATFKGTCDRDFYEAAMRDTLQCSRLIEAVR